ncbi:MAG: Vms1/Ankzf1 family peptidyl-tRNA hydrolase, partial [Bryobacteraceae bacterium]
LNTQSGQNGRDTFAPFLKKELHGRSKTFAPRSPERASFDSDVARIEKYVIEHLRPSSHGIAIFACAGAGDFFETVQLNAPLQQNEIHVAGQPHLYTLARINEQFPRYAVVLADTNSARLFVFGLGSTVGKEQVESPKVSHTQAGGWTQARFQRHVKNIHLHHAKEIVEALEQVVREDGIQHIIFGGDEVLIPVLRQQLSPVLAAKVIDVLHLDIKTPEHRILEATLASMRTQDAKDDVEKVERVIGDYRAGRLAVVGVQDVLEALANGQVEEVLLSTSLDEMQGMAEAGGASADAAPIGQASDSIVTHARQTGARLSFIEDPALLAEVGGVCAALRYRLPVKRGLPA